MYGSNTTIMSIEHDYLDLLKRCLGAETRVTRNSVVHSVFDATLRHDFSSGFPLLTTKRMFFRGVVEELAWFLRGSTDVKELQDVGVHIWDKNTENRSGDAGPVYGFQWRHFGAEYTSCKDYAEGVDQIQRIIDLIKTNPSSRRIFMSAWNPSQQDEMCLPPCHVSYQFYVDGNKLSCQMYQRSADMFLGVPFNIASYSLLMHILGKVLDLTPRYFIHSFGDAHIYLNSVDQVKEQIKRTPRELPQLKFPDINNLDDLKDLSLDDFILEGYDPHPAIKAKMAI